MARLAGKGKVRSASGRIRIHIQGVALPALVRGSAAAAIQGAPLADIGIGVFPEDIRREALPVVAGEAKVVNISRLEERLERTAACAEPVAVGGSRCPYSGRTGIAMALAVMHRVAIVAQERLTHMVFACRGGPRKERKEEER
jgi:hypothetical protein